MMLDEAGEAVLVVLAAVCVVLAFPSHSLPTFLPTLPASHCLTHLPNNDSFFPQYFLTLNPASC